MKLLLRRDQNEGVFGKITFILDVRADLSEQEKNNIEKYRFGKDILYEREKLGESNSNWGQLAATLKYRMLNLTISVNDLSKGKRVECKDIMEMLAVEEQIKEAAHTLKAVLDAAANFGGEEVIEIK